MPIIQKCIHCSEICGLGAKYCKFCTRAEMRKEMCKENKEIMPNWKCDSCKVV